MDSSEAAQTDSRRTTSGESGDPGKVTVAISDGCATITFERRHKRNAFTRSMFESLEQAIRDSGERSDVKILVLTGGQGDFCAGVDTAYFDAPRTARELKRGIEDHIQRVAYALESLDKPVVAAVSGPAVGAGMDLACMADVRIAAEDAMFSTGYIRLGLAPGGGGAFLLPRIVGEPVAVELLFTGRRIDAAEALRLGLVTQVVPVEDLLETATRFATSISRWDSFAIQLTKRALRAARHTDFSQAMDLASSHAAVLSADRSDSNGQSTPTTGDHV